MRGFGEIATLRDICEPDVGVITNIAPVHLEQVGSLEGVARAKAELLPGVATAVVPAGEPLLEPYLDGARASPASATAATSARRRRRSSRSASGSTSSCRSARATSAINALAAVAAAWRSACGRAAAWSCPSATCAASGSSCPAAPSSSTTATTPALCRCAPHSTSCPPNRPKAGASPCSATCSSWARARPSCTARSARPRRPPGVDVLVTVGPRAVAMLDAFDGESYAVADADEAAPLVGGAPRADRRDARQGLARRRARSRRRGAPGGAPHG